MPIVGSRIRVREMCRIFSRRWLSNISTCRSTYATETLKIRWDLCWLSLVSNASRLNLTSGVSWSTGMKRFGFRLRKIDSYGPSGVLNLCRSAPQAKIYDNDLHLSCRKRLRCFQVPVRRAKLENLTGNIIVGYPPTALVIGNSIYYAKANIMP